MVATAGVVPHLVARWSKLYDDHTSLSTSVTFLHLAGILVGGGFALVADRDALRLAAGTGPTAAAVDVGQLAGVHRWVLWGLALTFATGVLMFLSDVHTYVTSAIFWTKMGLIAFLLANGYLRLRAERALANGLAAGWRRLRQTSVASLVLWFAVLLAGTMLTNA